MNSYLLRVYASCYIPLLIQTSSYSTTSRSYEDFHGYLSECAFWLRNSGGAFSLYLNVAGKKSQLHMLVLCRSYIILISAL